MIKQMPLTQLLILIFNKQTSSFYFARGFHKKLKNTLVVEQGEHV